MAWKERGIISLSNNFSILYRQEKTGVYLRTITTSYLFKDTVGKYIILYLYVHLELRTYFVKAPFSTLFLLQNKLYTHKKGENECLL